MSREMTKPTKWLCAQRRLGSAWASAQSDQRISLGIHPVWSESSLSAWRKLGSLATQWAHSGDYDQTGRMPRLIWIFAGRTLILLVLSCCGSNHWNTSRRPVQRPAPSSPLEVTTKLDRTNKTRIKRSSLACHHKTSQLIRLWYIGDQRMLRRACASAQYHQSLCCSLTSSMEVNEGQKSSLTGWLRTRIWRWIYGGRKVP